MQNKKCVTGFSAVITLLAMMVSAHAQLDISLESSRDTYLLYEPIEFRIKLQNLTGSPVALQDHPVSKRAWLSFQIFDSGGDKVRPTGKFTIPPEVLKPGESKTVQVNITPMYSIRNTGQYDIRAAVNMAGKKSFMTGSIRFFVGKGELTWVRDIRVADEMRTYSLIRFLEKTRSTLYLRVEAKDENLVYSTTRLGEVVGFTKPQIEFDSEGKVHLLHVSTSTLHRYSRMSPEGAIEYQEDRKPVGGIPTLIPTNDGGVQLAGGFDVRKQVKRKKLSEDQMGL